MVLVHRSISSHGRQLRELTNMVTEGELLLSPPYQRGDVWTPQQRIALMKSLLLGVPVAAIVVNRRGDNAEWRANEGDPGGVWYACIDGKQRLTTLCQWHAGELAIPADWIDPELLTTAPGDTITATDLSTTGRRILGQRFIIPMAEATLPSLASEAETYRLINSAGTSHNHADLARAQDVERHDSETA
ncbi:DUF262 domain-containing protein [Amycolatopsis magusensis]|uniref:DUF262 domain-containing protein n=1 Tax=Amycolatopsis magusensis TaxID=882444 RepID=UPI0037981BFD